MKKIKHSLNSDKYTALLLLIPSLIGFFIFYLIPFVFSLYYSLINNIYSSKFVFFDNYIELFHNKSFILALKNTSVFLCIVVPTQLIISFILACIVDRFTKKKNIVVSFISIPLVLPIGCFYFMTQLVFSQGGIACSFLKWFGVNDSSLLQKDSIMLVVILVYLWRYLGYTFILYLSGLQFIPKELYEYAEIDGITHFNKLTRITIPLSAPISFIAFIVSFSNSLRVFKEVYVIGGNYPKRNIYMLQHYINNTFIDLNYSKLSATTIVISFLTVIVLGLWIKINKIYNGELL